MATHKANVYIDLSGWRPKYFPPELVRAAGGLLRSKVMFGSDYPLITPERWLADFAELGIDAGAPPGDPQGHRRTGAGAASVTTMAARRFWMTITPNRSRPAPPTADYADRPRRCST